MKKIVLIIVALCGFSLAGFGQMSIIDTNGTQIKNGDTVTIMGVRGTEMIAPFYLYDSAFSFNAKLRCFPTKDTIAGCTYSVCLGLACYLPTPVGNNFTSPTFKLPSGKDTNIFDADYNAVNAGITVIRYDLVNTNNTDSAWIYVKFFANPEGVPTITANNLRVSSLYPNPANSIVNFSYHTDYSGYISVYNSIGQLVKTVSLSSTKELESISTSDMPSGIYICKIQATGAEPAFRRLVVSH